MEQKHIKSELDRLKEQILPSFLSNILTRTSVLVKADPQKASDMLMKLGQLLRYQLYDCNRESVLLSAEINFIKGYLDLERMYNNCFEYKFTVDHKIKELFIPPLLFIPFVQHTISKMDDSDKQVFLHINIELKDDSLFFICQSANKEKLSEVELFGVKKRLNLLFKDNYSLSVTHNVIKLQLKTVSDYDRTIGVATVTLLQEGMDENQRTDELEAANLNTELMFLKSQINPHFLFNILNNANIMIKEDPDAASGMLVKLNEFITYQMKDSAQDSVLLEADIRFLGDYLELEKTRRDYFEYTIVTSGNTHIKIPPLLFIPFVENAVKHNLDSESLSFIHIKFTISEIILSFECDNSIPLKQIPKKGGGFSLANIIRRLDLLYRENYSLEQHKTERLYSVKLVIKYKVKQA